MNEDLQDRFQDCLRCWEDQQQYYQEREDMRTRAMAEAYLIRMRRAMDTENRLLFTENELAFNRLMAQWNANHKTLISLIKVVLVSVGYLGSILGTGYLFGGTHPIVAVVLFVGVIIWINLIHQIAYEGIS
jgi:hypothetical protein